MKTTISAFTAERVTENMKVIDWGKYASKCTHLKEIQFPIPGIRPIVDLLIEVDYAELHYSFKDVRGQPGEPVARFTPLGWTCTETTNGLSQGWHTPISCENSQTQTELVVYYDKSGR